MRSICLLCLPLVAAVLGGCAHAPLVDRPRLVAGVRLEDVRFHSLLLGRDMPYRVIVPTDVLPGAKLPVLWLLHGADASHESWSNETDIAEFAAKSGVALVMPEERNSYDIDTATGRRYQSYFVDEVVPDVRRRFPSTADDRAHNAVIGISRGGYGAIVIALKHPELFSYVAAMSPALDLAERSFRWRSPWSSFEYRRAFGPEGSITRHANDPFLLIEAPGGKTRAPYFYLVCGDRDELLPPTQRFAAALAQRGFASEMHITPGSHEWPYWNSQLPAIEASLARHLGLKP